MRRPTCEPGGGIRLLKFPGGVPGVNNRLGSKRHCPVHAACTAVKCWNGSFDHSLCRRHELMADRLLGEAGGDGRVRER